MTSEEVGCLELLIGCTLNSYGTTTLLNGTRTAIGEAFIETREGGTISIRSQMQSCTINGVNDDFATVSIGRSDKSLVDVAARKGSLFYDFSNSVITNVGVIRAQFTREASSKPIESCEIDLGIMIVTELGRIAVFNGSIWVSELDLEVLRDDVDLGELEGFASELGDVWETRTTVMMIGDEAR